MSLRPGRPAVKRDPCMFEKCRFGGTLVNLDGRHQRVLCADHATGLRDILTNRRAAYRVSWGLSSSEKLAKDEARLAALVSAYGEPREQPDEPAEFTTTEWWDDEDDAYAEPTNEERAWREIEELRWRIQDIRDDPERTPVVRVRVRTDE